MKNKSKTNKKKTNIDDDDSECEFVDVTFDEKKLKAKPSNNKARAKRKSDPNKPTSKPKKAKADEHPGFITNSNDPINIRSELMKKNYETCQTNPLIGTVMVYSNTNKSVILQNHSQEREHARQYLDEIGLTSRKGGEHTDFKFFEGMECPKGLCKEYNDGPPLDINDCFAYAVHTYCATLDRPDTQSIKTAIITFVDQPCFPSLTCSSHSKNGCGSSLSKGDIVKIDGSIGAKLVKGRVWYFTAIRINEYGHTVKNRCGVGIVKALATQAHLVANRIALVTDIIPQKKNSSKTKNLESMGKYAVITFVDNNVWNRNKK